MLSNQSFCAWLPLLHWRQHNRKLHKRMLRCSGQNKEDVAHVCISADAKVLASRECNKSLGSVRMGKALHFGLAMLGDHHCMVCLIFGQT